MINMFFKLNNLRFLFQIKRLMHVNILDGMAHKWPWAISKVMGSHLDLWTSVSGGNQYISFKLNKLMHLYNIFFFFFWMFITDINLLLMS